MSKYVYPEDGIKVVTFEKQDDLSPWPTVVTKIKINVPATERIKLSSDLFMQEIGSKLLRWSRILK
jgi:hypothetical protein